MTAITPPLIKGRRPRPSTTVRLHQISAWAHVGTSSICQMANDEQRKIWRRIVRSKWLILQATDVTRLPYRKVAREHASLTATRAMTPKAVPKGLEGVGTRKALEKHQSNPFL